MGYITWGGEYFQETCVRHHSKPTKFYYIYCVFIIYYFIIYYCDFSHTAKFFHNILSSRPVNNYPTPPVFHYHRPPMVSSYGIGVNHCPQSYPRRLSFFQLHPKPLMEIPVPLSSPYAFLDPPYNRAPLTLSIAWIKT